MHHTVVTSCEKIQSITNNSNGLSGTTCHTSGQNQTTPGEIPKRRTVKTIIILDSWKYQLEVELTASNEHDNMLNIQRAVDQFIYSIFRGKSDKPPTSAS